MATTRVGCKLGFPGGSEVKNPPANAGHMDSSSGLGRSSGEGNGHWLQYSCPGNPMDQGGWRAADTGTHIVGRDLATQQQGCKSKRIKP